MKTKRTALITAGLTIMLCAAVIVGSTFALFGVNKSREVTVTTGSVNLSAEFDADSLTLYSLNNSEVAQPTNSNTFNAGGTATIANGAVTLKNIVPGDRAEFALTMENTGATPLRYCVTYTIDNAAAEDVLNVGVTGGSIGAWSASDDPLASNETVTLNISVELDKSATQPLSGDATITFTIYAGQANASDEDLNTVFGL